MRDGTIGILGTGGTIVLQEVSLWLSIVCASLTITHFAIIFYGKFKDRNKDAKKEEK